MVQRHRIELHSRFDEHKPSRIDEAGIESANELRVGLAPERDEDEVGCRIEDVGLESAEW